MNQGKALWIKRLVMIHKKALQILSKVATLLVKLLEKRVNTLVLAFLKLMAITSSKTRFRSLSTIIKSEINQKLAKKF